MFLVAILVSSASAVLLARTQRTLRSAGSSTHLNLVDRYAGKGHSIYARLRSGWFAYPAKLPISIACHGSQLDFCFLSIWPLKTLVEFTTDGKHSLSHSTQMDFVLVL